VEAGTDDRQALAGAIRRDQNGRIDEANDAFQGLIKFATKTPASSVGKRQAPEIPGRLHGPG